jgi:hypothetical protein
MDFKQALSFVENGGVIRRNVWPVGEFVFMQVPSIIDGAIVPKMQSLPQSVKYIFEKRFANELMQLNAIYYSNQLAICDSSNSIRGYSPSVEDCFALDWKEFKE